MGTCGFKWVLLVPSKLSRCMVSLGHDMISLGEKTVFFELSLFCVGLMYDSVGFMKILGCEHNVFGLQYGD
jgi:hypothetical protein